MKKTKSELLAIPGIGKTFAEDFARIGVTKLSQIKGKDPSALFAKLERANTRLGTGQARTISTSSAWRFTTPTAVGPIR